MRRSRGGKTRKESSLGSSCDINSSCPTKKSAETLAEKCARSVIPSNTGGQSRCTALYWRNTSFLLHRQKAVKRKNLEIFRVPIGSQARLTVARSGRGTGCRWRSQVRVCGRILPPTALGYRSLGATTRRAPPGPRPASRSEHGKDCNSHSRGRADDRISRSRARRRVHHRCRA